MKVNIIKKAIEVTLNDDETSYAIQDIKETQETYPIHQIKWAKDIYNYVFQDENIERLMKEYNEEWERLHNKVFELGNLNLQYDLEIKEMQRMNVFEYLHMRFKKLVTKKEKK